MENLSLVNQSFEFVKSRTYSPTYEIYKGNNNFLRIGPQTEIAQELIRHTELSGLGFPIAQIINQGTHEERSFYIEESMGDIILDKVFADDCVSDQKISDQHFNEFIDVVATYANAQLKSTKSSGNLDEFMKGFYLDVLYKERPDLNDLIDSVFAKVRDKLKELPFALTHGDFNAHNLFPKGVIDLENFHYGPLGYDLATVIVHPYFYPPVHTNTESNRTYLFTLEQELEYFKKIDALFINHNFQPLTTYLDEYTLCRAVFVSVEMHHRQLVQEWRYQLLEKLMQKYVHGEAFNLREITC